MVEEKESDQENPQRKSVSAEGRKESQRISVSQNRPPISDTSNPIKKDPVSEQKKKDEKDMRKTQVIPQKESNLSTQIKPTLSKRIDLKFVDDGTYKEGEPRSKYVVPRTKRQQRYYEKNRANTAKKFCKYSSSKVPKPQPDRKMDLKIEVPSPEPSQAKVTPRRVTPTASMLYPYPQTDSELKIKKPKSGIIINEKEAEGHDSDDDYDSFDLVFSRKPRPKSSSRKRSKSRKHDGLEDIVEDEEEADGTREKKKKKKKGKQKKCGMEETAEGEAEEAEADEKADYLTKQFRRKVSQMSAATSYHSQLIEPSEQEMVGEPAFSKYVQKFRRESEMQRYQPIRRKVKRGTLESHSFTDINQVVLKDFFFGSKEGTMHQGDPSFAPSVRNIQGLCMPVAAYCYSILKHPNKWTRENIDEILGYGNDLFSQSARVAHIHNLSKLLEFNELQKYCIIGEKKIRFTVDDPEVAGYIRSDDKKVYNLTKALRIFFSRNTAGILKTQDICIGVWKHKYFYMFDARPRTRDLFCSPSGTAIMANFYDVSALATVFLARSNFGNWPFVIYPLKALKVLNRDDPEVDSNAALDVASEYNILNANKAVVLASLDLADKCFDFSRNKQSLAMAVVCLAYSRITPPSAWHRTTVDKIMIIGNQLYLQCLECESIVDLKLDNLPALFTIGPYIVEIYIYANVYADLLFRSCCCQLRCCLEEFFEKCTNAIVQIGKGFLAVWKQRNMFYCFDPYSRNNEGYRCRDGAACVSMHSTVESLVEVITTNFDDKDTIFYVHAMKVCKIHRDPAQTSRFPKHLAMDDIAVDEVKQYKMKKSKKAAIEKPVTVDYSALAMRRLLAGESPQDSIFDIGSTVESLAMEQLPPMLHKNVSKSILKAHPKVVDVVADLDSPSLSDTQIEPPLPQQPKITEDIEFLDLDSFELTMEEIELEVVAQQEDENEQPEEGEGMMMAEGESDFEQAPEEANFMGLGGEGDDLDDWFFATDMYSQYSGIKKPSQMSEQVNTDITYFPIKREILYPTYLRDRQRVKYRLQKYRFTEEDWENYLPPSPPEITRSEELRKETNFVNLPDDTQIILGGKNVADAGGEDVEFVAPFVCIMAGVVAKKYSISSWTGEIVDYIIKCGNELHAASKFRYDQVSKLEIPRISLGNTDFTVLVEYIFDSYTRQNILELALEKILFVRSDVGIFVTPVYACAVFYKNHLYYVYDCFGNNEVGLSEGPSGKGTACLARFKDLRSLTSRMMYNKRKRESSEEIVYSRFVLSSVKVKELRDAGKEKKKKKKKSKARKTDAAKDDEYLYQGEDEMDEIKPEEEKKDEDSVDEDEKPVDEDEKLEEKEKKKEPENKIGYQYKNGFYTIQGTKAVAGRKTVTEELKEDHFICLCACLVLLTCPVKKWDTKKVDKVLEYGKHVYSHAEDLNISQKRTIKNVLIGEHFFDVIVKSIKIENWRDNKSLNEGIDTILGRKMSYFLVQFPNACYVIHKSSDAILHLFDPYGVPKSQKAGWTRFKDARHLKRRLRRIVVAGGESYKFYTFEMTSIQKAPKGLVLSHKLEEYEMEAAVKKEYHGKPFYEDVEWLQTDPVPWSRRKDKSACGKTRGALENMWFNWDEEYPKDLYSLVGNIHEYNERFSNKTKGKQTLANLITAIGMMEIYDLSEWNSSVVDSVLVNGDHYFADCIQDISDEDYEITMDDLKPDCSIFPFSFQVALAPVVEGTMFLVRLTQFNLYKALRYFFDGFDARYGLICCTKSDRKKHVAFGKLRDAEYFVFDSGCRGAPMFPDGAGVAYILRMTTLNRLLYVLTLTLRGGDFYVHEVTVSDLKPMS
ncbi:unnamed protein product [Phaedon cochleariae]|uniref:Uncharacterized protein n=1 Tax=Phaedon cochleariae TaxID=80249 RepID=A0A9P0DAN7_PHACE|nr:unnamed protein product [Phaedon cochleariae]